MAIQRSNSAKLLDHAKRMRQQPSDAERRLWQLIRNRHLDGLKFRRQLPIGPYIADFACDEVKLIVEVDGRQHDDAVAYDVERTAYLSLLGWTVIRFDAGEVVKDLDAVCQTILNRGRPSP